MESCKSHKSNDIIYMSELTLDIDDVKGQIRSYNLRTFLMFVSYILI